MLENIVLIADRRLIGRNRRVAKNMYRDITTHSQRDKERKMSILENETNGIKFTVHKHICYGDEWLLTCREIGVEHLRLHTEDMEEAKEKGITEMIRLLGIEISRFEKAIAEITV